ncbi:MAG: nucleotidyltransferase family protein [Phycisphaerae bacterium]
MKNIDVPRERIAAFCRKHGIRRLAVFGSALRADFRPDSDIDLLVEFRPDRIPTLFDMAGMEQELSQMLGGRKVDLRTPEDLSHYFRQQVLAEAEVRYEDG